MYRKIAITVLILLLLIWGVYGIFSQKKVGYFCGNDVCEPQENYVNCPKDCQLPSSLLPCPEDTPIISFQIYDKGKPTNAFGGMPISIVISTGKTVEFKDSIKATLNDDSSVKLYCSDITEKKLPLSNYYDEFHIFAIKEDREEKNFPKDFEGLYVSTDFTELRETADIKVEAPFIKAIKGEKNNGNISISLDASMDQSSLNDSFAIITRECNEYVKAPSEEYRTVLTEELIPPETKLNLCKEESALPICVRSTYDVIPCRKLRFGDLKELIVTDKIVIDKNLKGSIKIDDVSGKKYSFRVILTMNTNIEKVKVRYITDYIDL